MRRHIRHLTAGALALVLAIGTLGLGVAPAGAEEPTDPPIAQPTAEPTAEPTPSSEPEPTPEPTESAAPEPSATPTPEPTAPTTTPPAGATAEYTGTVNRLSSHAHGDDHGDESAIAMLYVAGRGHLSVDTTGWPESDLRGRVTLTLAVPAGVTQTGDFDADFAALASAAAKSPLEILGARPGRMSFERETSALVNQTPSTAATHRIYVVLVSPNNLSTPSSLRPTAANVAASVAHADDYWSEQSEGTIGFEVAGTVPWYKSSYSCKTDSGSTALWNQAAAKAKTAIGYSATKNNHLVLVFPSDIDCDGGIGLGTIGWSVNDGGLSWVMGDGSGRTTATPAGDSGLGKMEKATLVHELGHNLSLGHATWIDCSSSQPNPGFNGLSGCTRKNYGDITDVMGFGDVGYDGGALSSAQAIRSSIWPNTAWTTAPQGTNSYVLNDVASNSGLRSVVVQDTNGVNYFIEYRNFADEDAQYSGYGCDADACVAATGGVRVLRLENADLHPGDAGITGMLGFPGDDSFLMGRTESGVDKVNFTTGQTWRSQGASGLQVNVTSTTSTTATIQVIKGSDTTVNPTIQFWILPTTTATSSGMGVGDVWTAFVGDTWEAQTTTITWYRGSSWWSVNEVIGTGQNYTLTAADLGKYIGARLQGQNPGGSTVTMYDPAVGEGYGPIAKGIYGVDDPGTVAISNATTPLVATPSDFPAGTTFAYQWYRGSSATTATTAATGAGATTANYTPNSADYNQFLRVRVTATIPGYSNKPVRYSSAKNYSIKSDQTIAIAGTPKVGSELTVDTSGVSYYSVDGSLSGVTHAYQWLRDGVAISGADATDDTDYTPTSADYLKKLSLRVTTSKPGWVNKVMTTPTLSISQKGTIQTSSPEVTMVRTVDKPGQAYSFKLTATVSGVTEPGVTTKYQWYRVNRTTSAATAITGAVSSVYRPTASDYAYELKVRVVLTKSNYTTQTLYSDTKDYSIRLDTGGNPYGWTDTTLSVDDTAVPLTPQFTIEQDNGSFTTLTLAAADLKTFSYYRSGTKITGASGATYPVVAADVGKTLSFRLDVREDGWLPIVQAKSTSTAVVTLKPFASIDPPQVTQTGLTLTVGSLSSTPAATSYSYQWYRNGVAVKYKTTPTYVLTSADFGKTVTVKVTFRRSGYQSTVVQAESGLNGQWWIAAASPQPVISGDIHIGGTLTVDSRVYTNQHTGATLTEGVDVDVAYQWLRNGVAIPAGSGGTASTYELTGSDKGKAISVRIVASDPAGLVLSNTSTSAATQLVGTERIVGAPGATVTVAPTGGSTPTATTLQATVTGVTDSGPVTYKYQWYRNGVAVKYKTASTYVLSSADFGKDVWVRVIISKAAVGTTTYTTVVRYSDATDYSIRPDTGGTPPYVSGNNWRVGEQVGVYGLNFVTKDGALGSPTISYQWLRSGVVIPGATSANYMLAAADYNKVVTVRLTVRAAGYVTLVHAPVGTKVVKGVTVGTPVVEVVPAGAGVVKAQFQSGTLEPATPTPALTYKWYRDNPADATPPAVISGATASTYKFTSADVGREISVQVTMKRTNFTVPTTALPRTTGVDYTIRSDGAVPTISGTAKVGVTLTATPPTYFEADGTTPIGTAPTLKFTWYRSGTAISGATASSYVLAAADLGKKITVRVTATLPGRLGHTSGLSASTATVVIGTIDPGTLAVTTTSNSTVFPKVTFALTGSSVTPGPIGYAYQWYRDNPADANPPAKITGATASSYTLTASDTAREVSVIVTLKKSGFTSLALPATIANDISYGEDAVIVGTPAVGETLNGDPPFFYLASGVQTMSYTMQWLRDGVPIDGATGYDYTVVAEDAGTDLTFRVTVAADRHATLVLTTDPASIP